MINDDKRSYSKTIMESNLRRCRRCKTFKKLELFVSSKRGYLDKGYLCNICSNEDSRERYQKKIAEDPLYRERHNSLKTKNRLANIEAYREKYKLRSRTPQGRARNKLQRAVREGAINKPETCSSCGKKSIIHGHHTDYLKPLSVMWLCAQCHSDEHRKLKEKG